MIEISEADLHPHLKARMSQRGITIEEIERVLNEGWEATDAKPGTQTWNPWKSICIRV